MGSRYSIQLAYLIQVRRLISPSCCWSCKKVMEKMMMMVMVVAMIHRRHHLVMAFLIEEQIIHGQQL